MSAVAERVLVDLVADFLSAIGGAVYREVPSLGQSADLVHLQCLELTFVEVKINAIKRAMAQCRTHELIADYICIAVLSKSVKEDTLCALRDKGYGLLSCSIEQQTCEWLLQPRKLGTAWEPMKRRVLKRLEEEALCPSIG